MFCFVFEGQRWCVLENMVLVKLELYCRTVSSASAACKQLPAKNPGHRREEGLREEHPEEPDARRAWDYTPCGQHESFPASASVPLARPVALRGGGSREQRARSPQRKDGARCERSFQLMKEF